ncbi:hypothetical protein C0215_19985 [Clostridioides difficile]|nr:hypothetical protein C0215_19985 [Clostridioides difficile]
MWLCRPVAVAPIRPLAWEYSYATGAALKDRRKKKREREREIDPIHLVGYYSATKRNAVLYMLQRTHSSKTLTE